MKFKAIDELLPRETDQDLDKILNQFSDLIDDAINFSTHLIKWDIEKEGGDERMPPVMFFRNMIELADGISILVRKSSIEASKPLVRSLLENMLNLEYILEKNTTERALTYIIWTTMKKLKALDKYDTTTQAGKQQLKTFNSDKLVKENYKNLFDNHLLNDDRKKLNSLLKHPKYSEIFSKINNQNIKNINHWYSLFDGPKNVYELAKHLKLVIYYDVFYRSLSENVHTTNIYDNKLILEKDGSNSVLQIRFAKDAQSITQNTINILTYSINNFFKNRMPERKYEMLSWYSNFSKANRKLNERKLIGTSI